MAVSKLTIHVTDLWPVSHMLDLVIAVVVVVVVVVVVASCLPK